MLVFISLSLKNFGFKLNKRYTVLNIFTIIFKIMIDAGPSMSTEKWHRYPKCYTTPYPGYRTSANKNSQKLKVQTKFLQQPHYNFLDDSKNVSACICSKCIIFYLMNIFWKLLFFLNLCIYFLTKKYFKIVCCMFIPE